jgi:hypothetical protein
LPAGRLAEHLTLHRLRANRNFREVNVADVHSLAEHGMRRVPSSLNLPHHAEFEHPPLDPDDALRHSGFPDTLALLDQSVRNH